MQSKEFETFYREEFGRILAALIRAIGDFELAEDAVQEAFAAAIEQWPSDGTPDNPRGWIIGVARNKAIDRMRRHSRFTERSDELRRMIEDNKNSSPSHSNDYAVPDERLSLIFTCCHPALAPEAQIALSLRTLCGLSTEEIARAFLMPAATMAQRLVRAKRKIRAARIPYEVPRRDRLPERLDAVMTVVYLVFNEGYLATAGSALIRCDLATEAIRLGRMLVELMPLESEPRGMLAMMLLNHARRDARVDSNGELVLLEDQDRSRWDRGQIEEGLAQTRFANDVPSPGPYALQAAIVAEHAQATRASETNWKRIAQLYEELMRVRPTPIVELNRAVAVAMAEGPAVGLALIHTVEARGDLSEYYWMWSAKADLLRRLQRFAEAQVYYRRALEFVGSEPERRFLNRRLAEIDALSGSETT
jgi:RNA polymerase sigma-70 factor (ECF subfamily)